MCYTQDMPKIVDHDKQRKKVAEAAWRVIRRDGLEQASVRNIAAEAGLSPGSMRHYFTTQSDLLAFSMKLVSERVNERILQLPLSGELREDILMLLCEILPMDDERRAEMEVWVAFMAKSLVDPKLKFLSDEVSDSLRSGVERMIHALVAQEPRCRHLDAALEAERLSALVDGLAMHMILQPELVTPMQTRAILIHHLRNLYS